MAKDIWLSNREGGDLWLERVGEQGWYRFCCTRPEYFLQYSRFIFDEDPEKPYAFDPPGGPFLSIGGIFKDGRSIKEIKNMKHGIYFKIE